MNYDNRGTLFILSLIYGGNITVIVFYLVLTSNVRSFVFFPASLPATTQYLSVKKIRAYEHMVKSDRSSYSRFPFASSLSILCDWHAQPRWQQYRVVAARRCLVSEIFLRFASAHACCETEKIVVKLTRSRALGSTFWCNWIFANEIASAVTSNRS